MFCVSFVPKCIKNAIKIDEICHFQFLANVPTHFSFSYRTHILEMCKLRCVVNHPNNIASEKRKLNVLGGKRWKIMPRNNKTTLK